MGNANTDLHEAIERAALAAYGELLSPELAHAAASAFARETAEMVEDLLHDGAAALRERIEGQLATLNGGKAKAAKKKPGRPAAASKGEAAPAPASSPSGGGKKKASPAAAAAEA